MQISRVLSRRRTSARCLGPGPAAARRCRAGLRHVVHRHAAGARRRPDLEDPRAPAATSSKQTERCRSTTAAASSCCGRPRSTRWPTRRTRAGSGPPCSALPERSSIGSARPSRATSRPRRRQRRPRRHPYRTAVRQRLALLLARGPTADHKQQRQRLLDDVGAGVARRLDLLGPERAEETLASRRRRTSRDTAVQTAIKQALHLLPRERQFDLKRMEDSADTARRLANQSQRGRDRAPRRAQRAKSRHGDRDAGPMPPSTDGWPRWSGVSMYRPSKLDDLMNAGYQRFAFHRRVHWAALLGAANLIEQHPRALWRLVSSLLATASAGTRRDVLRRLTGADSVIWGLRDQFQVMAPAPTLTLSLERRQHAQPRPTASAEAARARENYLLRLEVDRRAARSSPNRTAACSRGHGPRAARARTSCSQRDAS